MTRCSPRTGSPGRPSRPRSPRSSGARRPRPTRPFPWPRKSGPSGARAAWPGPLSGFQALRPSAR
eukprot:11113348-Alexandrium_andersonii.AAC.1